MEENQYAELKAQKETSFRRFKKLTEEEKQVYLKSDLYPAIKVLALKYHRLTSRHIERCLRWAEKHWDDYKEIEVPFSDQKFLSRQAARRELIFRGFIPIEEFETLPHQGYITSNSNILGGKLIYPKYFGYDVRGNFENGVCWNIHSLYGLSGYTQVYIIKG